MGTVEINLEKLREEMSEGDQSLRELGEQVWKINLENTSPDTEWYRLCEIMVTAMGVDCHG